MLKIFFTHMYISFKYFLLKSFYIEILITSNPTKMIETCN